MLRVSANYSSSSLTIKKLTTIKIEAYMFPNYSEKQSPRSEKVKVSHVIPYSHVISGLIIGFINLSSMIAWIDLSEL